MPGTAGSAPPQARQPISGSSTEYVDVYGRGRELELIAAAVAAGRDLMLEGPPGTSKSTMLRTIATTWGIPFTMVEGNAELTPGRLIGHHSPARVISDGYSMDTFVPGPLVQAMQNGGFLYIEELNRAPEDTLNVLLGAMAERAIIVPRAGTIAALPTFRLLASMNPFDSIGTSRISDSVYDRWCRLAIDYQDADAEATIVHARSSIDDDTIVRAAVTICRATRTNPDLHRGSSVRGAIDLAALAAQLDTSVSGAQRGREWVITQAAFLALSARIAVDPVVDKTPEQVIQEICDDYFLALPGTSRDTNSSG